MILSATWIPGTWSCILHVCGDDPFKMKQLKNFTSYSPRMWRWSLEVGNETMVMMVFSTYVEMILAGAALLWLLRRILHVCGDDPKQNTISFEIAVYSPRMWRWSQLTDALKDSLSVFSTYVEMILVIYTIFIFVWSILHVCGDDPRDTWENFYL